MALCLGPPGVSQYQKKHSPTQHKQLSEKHAVTTTVKHWSHTPFMTTVCSDNHMTIQAHDYTHLHSFTKPVLFSAVTPCWARPVKQTGDSGSRFQAGQCPCHHTTRLELLGAAFMETITQQCQCTEGIKSWLQPGKSHPTSDYWGKKTTTSTFTVTLTEWLKVHTLLGDRGRIIKQSSVCFPVSTGRQN